MPVSRKRKPPRLTARQQRLAEAHQALAYHAADYYAERCPVIRRLPRDDRVGAAMLGLSVAAQRFDPRRGVAFSTVAMPWMRHALQREAMHARVVSLPLDLLHQPARIGAERRRQIDAVLGMASLDAAPDAIGLQDADHAEWRDREREAGVDPDLERWIRRALDRLPWREARAVRLRFWEGLSLEQGGLRLGVGKERFRQILARGLERLRRAMREAAKRGTVEGVK